jgi:hypothetical protein
MSNLSFYWIAIFKDGTRINQFNEDGSENMFQLIKDRFDELGYFNLTNMKGKLFTVSLLNGLIGYNDLVLPYREAKERKDSIRLVYFRRHRVEMTDNGIKKSHTIEYHLGLQWVNSNNENRNIILQIDENGDFIIDGK